MKAKSRFFAYLERLKWIKRWGLKRNVVEENVMEHSWQVATIAHALAIIHNREFGGQINEHEVATAALYHDVSEIITGDLPSPVKYHSQKIQQAYKAIEHEAEQEMLSLLPESLREDYRSCLIHDDVPEQIRRFVKAADIISAFLKCQFEVRSGNDEFSTAQDDLQERLREMNMPEVEYFLYTFVDSYLLTLDELLKQHDRKS